MLSRKDKLGIVKSAHLDAPHLGRGPLSKYLRRNGHEWATENVVRSLMGEAGARATRGVGETDISPEPGSGTITNRDGAASLVVEGVAEKDPQKLAESYGYDMDRWEVYQARVKVYQMGQKGDAGSLSWEDGKVSGTKEMSGELAVKTLYSHSIRLRLRKDYIAAGSEIAELKEQAKKLAVRIPKAKRGRKTGTRHMLVLGVPDVHLGRLSWAPESGQNYDVKIARDMFIKAHEDLIEQVSGYSFDHVLYPIGNDLYNVDNAQQSTFAGTPQHEDVRYQRSHVIGREVVTEAIHMLRALAPVKVVVVPGNHDVQRAWYLGDSLECLFHKTADVDIDNLPALTKYHAWKKVLLGLNHGKEVKAKDLPLVMATDPKVRSEYALALHHEWLLGHIHQEVVYEKRGIKTYFLPSLAVRGAWEALKEYGHKRQAQAIVYHPEMGRRAVFHHLAV